MARLFSKDYHELSNSWYFNHAVIPLSGGDLWYWIVSDEAGRYQMRFFPSKEKTEYFSDWVEVLYDPIQERIISHKCAECSEDESCRHYLSLLRYAYLNLSTDIFEQKALKTCDGNSLRGNTGWLELAHEARISVEGIYDPSADKIRFYHDTYRGLDMQSLIKLLHNQQIEDERLAANFQVLDDYELRLFAWLHENRAAYSAKGAFWSIYKKDFAAALALLEHLEGRIIIRETGEMLSFASSAYPLALRVEPAGQEAFRLSPVMVEELSVWYAGYPTWLFFRNKVHKVFLPFTCEVVDKLFHQEMRLSAQDLVYYRSIVHAELSRKDIYLDFDSEIELPVVIDSMPKCRIQISSFGQKILIEGFLIYDARYEIPLSVLRYGKALVYSPYQSPEDEGQAWFFLPHQIFNRVKHLLDKLPEVELNMWEQNAQLVFPESSFDALQQAIFKLNEEEWEVEIADELSNRFITKIALEAEIEAIHSAEIDWFSYSISYRYKDLRFTHDELKKYFRGGDQLVHTVDGRIYFISNPQILSEMQKLISHSEELGDSVYRARVMNLPYYQRLQEENPALRMQADEYLEHMFRDLQQRHLERKIELPYYLQTVLRGYQKAGVAWISMLSHYHLGGILADEMGLGKTIQALTVILNAPEDTTSMVICPKTLIYNWAAEIEKFHTNIPYAIVEGPKAERNVVLKSPNIRLFLISYSMVLSDLPILREMNFEWIVLDEAQNIKNVSAQRTSAIKKLRSKHRLALSGTPIENRITELWSIMDFLMPGYLGSLKRFKNIYQNPEEEREAQKALHRSVSPFLLRRIKKEVLMELPDKQEQVSWCKMSPIQEKLYLQIIDTVQKKLLPENSENMSYVHILAALTKLRQVCNHPHLANSDILPELELSAKLEMLVELVQESLAGGHKVLVFSQFVQMLGIMKRCFDALDIPYSYLDGHTRDRQGQIHSFENDESIRLFLISLKTGGTGLNLTAADTVILYDPWWNPMVENQAIDRAHRLGQSKKVQVFRLITKNTVEEKILSLQKSKIDLFNEVIEGGSTVLKTMNMDELKGLFSY